ncbi:MAG: hypothetical protein M1825_001929 [Sarcosagium campestre]|nr:MAG: hypothetical protein M1825_001929 [Sarcosagium campestre]
MNTTMYINIQDRPVPSVTILPRVKKKPTEDPGTIHNIVNTASVVHVSFAPPPPRPTSGIDNGTDNDASDSDSEGTFPTILPMIGQMGSYAYPSAGPDEPQDCYLHGYVTSRIMSLASSTDKDANDKKRKGLPVCIAATHVDGLVLSLTPNSHSYNYRSAVLHGHAVVVNDPAEKLWAMERITDGVVPGRWAHTRTPPDAAEMQSTRILRVEVVAGSGKVRSGGPHDDRKDVERADVTQNVWTGTVPVWQALGTPVRGGDGGVEEVPAYLAEYVREANEANEAVAVRAADRE